MQTTYTHEECALVSVSQAFSNLTNQHSPNVLSPQSKSPSHKPGASLEQENQLLKSQIELLKSALLGICKDQNIQLPHLLPLLKPEQEKRLSRSPQKSEASVKEPNDQENIHSHSAVALTKSSNRRKRVDRMSPNPTSQSKQSATLKSAISHKELPLQMPKAVRTGNESLLLDQSKEEVLERPSIMRSMSEFQREPLTTEERADNSQIHLKYVKLLEELDGQSINITINQGEHKSPQASTEQKQRESSVKRVVIHVKNKKSSQFEQKQFYENELNNLKTELEEFSKEEQKLLEMLVVTKPVQDASAKKSPDRHDYVSFNTSPSKITNHDATPHKAVSESFPYQEDYHQVPMQELDERTYSLTNDELLNNLREAALHLDEVKSNYEEITLIKPVKIDSPTKPMEKSASFTKFARVQLYPELLIGNRTPKVNKKSFAGITPIKEVINVVSAERYKRSYNDQIAKRHILKGSRKSIVNKLDQQSDCKLELRVSSKKPFVPRSNKKREQQANQLSKCPSQFSIYHLFDSMSHNPSPLRHILKTENRYMPADQSTESFAQYEQQLEEDSARQPTQENLETIAKRKSMAAGLRQQEEPPEDDFPMRTHTECSDNTQDLYDKIQDEEAVDTFFGLYTMEKSEQMKVQRHQSIQKAEELLGEYLKAKAERPQFLTSGLNYQQQHPSDDDRMETSQSCIIKEEEIISVDAESECQLKEEKTPHQMSEVSFHNNEVGIFNCSKLNSSHGGNDTHRSSKQVTTESPEDDQVESPRLEPQFISSYQAYHHQQMKSPLIAAFDQFEAQTNNKRMSAEYKAPSQEDLASLHSSVKRRQSTGVQSSRQFKSYQPIQKSAERKPKQPVDTSTSGNTSTFQTFASGLTSNNTFCQTISTATISSSIKQQEMESIYFHQKYSCDPELLYEKRSKSVLKRREELLKKKEQEQKNKIDAKYQKIDQLKQNRIQRNTNIQQNKSVTKLKGKPLGETSVTQYQKEAEKFLQDKSKDLSQYDSIQEKSTARSAERRPHSSINTTPNAIQRLIHGLYHQQTKETPQELVRQLNNSSSVMSEMRQANLMSQRSSHRPEDDDFMEAPRSHQRIPESVIKSQKPVKSLTRGMRLASKGNQRHQLEYGLGTMKLQSTIDIHSNYDNYNDTLSTTLQGSQSSTIKASNNNLVNAKTYSKAHQKSACRESQMMSSSRSNQKYVSDQATVYYNSKSTVSNISNTTPHRGRDCRNCQRLSSKGISTEFCLEHSNTQLQ